MRVLIAQPFHEEKTEQLEYELRKNKGINVVLFPEGYLSNETALEQACKIAAKHDVTIITSYRRDNKDRAAVINNLGELVLERAKTPADELTEIYEPCSVNINRRKIGYILCMEILKGERDLRRVSENMYFIAHPIGVGMFSEEQFEEWINEAKKIAKKYNTMIIGTSHADGSYRNCGISIPIAYFIDSNGEEIFVSRSDTRTRIVNLQTKEVQVN